MASIDRDLSSPLNSNVIFMDKNSSLRADYLVAIRREYVKVDTEDEVISKSVFTL